MVDARARTQAKQRRVIAAAAPVRAVLTAAADDGPLQTIQAQALAGELIDQAERLQDYGFAAAPHAGAEAVIVFAGGRRNHPLVIAVADRRYRLKALETGEVALYDDQGQAVHLTRDGIEVRTAKEITLQAVGAIEMVSDTSIRLAAPAVAIEAPAQLTVTTGAFSVAAATIAMVATGLARLAGAIARLHGEAQVAWDANGTGMSFTPVARKYHYTGTAAQEVAPAPPEVP